MPLTSSDIPMSELKKNETSLDLKKRIESMDTSSESTVPGMSVS